MAGLPLVSVKHESSGQMVNVWQSEYSCKAPLFLCGRRHCSHYREQGRLPFADEGPRDGYCALAEMSVAESCIALDVEMCERFDREYRAACTIEEAAACEVERKVAAGGEE